MASKLCLRIKTFDLNNKMSPEFIRPISECIKFLPRNNKRLITTLSSNKTVTDYDKNLIHSKNLLQPRTTSQLKYNKVRSNFGLEDGSNRFLKTLSSLLSPGNDNWYTQYQLYTLNNLRLSQAVYHIINIFLICRIFK